MRSVSATQIKQFRGCGLQWYLQRVEGWPYPQSDSQALGEQVHAQVERYLLEGVTEDLTPSVANAITKKLVPAFGEIDHRIVEEPKDYDMKMTCAGVPVKGRIDLMLPPTGDGLVKVVDWKTAKSFNYTPTPDALTRDVQGILYLRYAFEQFPFAKTAQFRHVYLLTKGTGSKKVDGEVVDEAFVAGQWSHLEQTVEEMRSTGGRPLAVVAANQANLSHCDAFGGCKFRDRCPAASKGLVASMFDTEAQAPVPEGERTMSALAEKLRARRLATTTAPVPVPKSIDDEAPVVEVPATDAEKSAVHATAAADVAVLPPDAPKAEESLEKNDRPIPGKKTRARPFAKPAEAEVPVVVAPVVVEEVPVVVPDVPVEVVFDPIVESVVLPEPPVVEAPRTLALFIDCYPEKASFESLSALEDEIAARTPSLLEHLRKTSPKDVPEGTVDLGEVLYGRGFSTLAASFALKPIHGYWTVSTYGPAASKMLEVLMPKATFVVRGRR